MGIKIKSLNRLIQEGEQFKEMFEQFGKDLIELKVQTENINERLCKVERIIKSKKKKY